MWLIIPLASCAFVHTLLQYASLRGLYVLLDSSLPSLFRKQQSGAADGSPRVSEFGAGRRGPGRRRLLLWGPHGGNRGSQGQAGALRRFPEPRADKRQLPCADPGPGQAQPVVQDGRDDGRDDGRGRGQMAPSAFSALAMLVKQWPAA